MLGNRIGRNLSSAAASRRGWPRTRSPKVRAAMESFSEQFRFARAKARPRDMLPFLDELDGWLARFVAGGHDLLFLHGLSRVDSRLAVDAPPEVTPPTSRGTGPA